VTLLALAYVVCCFKKEGPWPYSVKNYVISTALMIRNSIFIAQCLEH